MIVKCSLVFKDFVTPVTLIPRFEYHPCPSFLFYLSFQKKSQYMANTGIFVLGKGKKPHPQTLSYTSGLIYIGVEAVGVTTFFNFVDNIFGVKE